MAHRAIIDIGSTSVGGVLFETSKHPTTTELCSRLLTSVRHDIVFQENLDLSRYLDGISAALKQTLNDLLASKYGAPTDVLCFLSAPFYASQTNAILKKETAPFAVTEKLVNGLIEQNSTKFEAKNEVLESLAMNIELDGYVLENPYRQSAQELRLTHYVSIAEKAVVDRFREAVAGTWHHREISFHSFAYAFYKGLTTIVPDKKNFLVMDICGEITELSLVWRGLLWETISFPLGRNWLIRRLATGLGTTPAEALSALKLYRGKNQHDAASDKVLAALTTAKAEWLASFREALGKVLNNCLLPDNIFVLADGQLAELFHDWLAEEQFDALTISNKRFQINVLREDIFKSLCAHGSTEVHDFILMIEALYCDMIKK